MDLAAVDDRCTAGGRTCQRGGAGALDIAAVAQGVACEGQRIGRILANQEVPAVVDSTAGSDGQIPRGLQGALVVQRTRQRQAAIIARLGGGDPDSAAAAVGQAVGHDGATAPGLHRAAVAQVGRVQLQLVVRQQLAAVAQIGARFDVQQPHAVERAAVVDAGAAAQGGVDGGGACRLDGAAVVQLGDRQLQAVRSTCAQQRAAVGERVACRVDVQPPGRLQCAGVGEVACEGDAAIGTCCRGGDQGSTGVVDQAAGREGAAALGLHRAAVGDASAADRQRAVAQDRAVHPVVVQVESLARCAQSHCPQALDQARIGQLGVGCSVGEGQCLVSQNLAAGGVLDGTSAGGQCQLCASGMDLAAVGDRCTAGGRPSQRGGAGALDIAAVAQGVSRQGQRIGRILGNQKVPAVVDGTIGNHRQLPCGLQRPLVAQAFAEVDAARLPALGREQPCRRTGLVVQADRPDGGRIGRLHRAGVGEVAALNLQGSTRKQGTAVVQADDLPRSAQRQLTGGLQRPAVVQQGFGIGGADIDLAGTQYLALIADGGARADIELRGGMDAAFCTYRDFADRCLHTQCTWRYQGGRAQVEVALCARQVQAAVGGSGVAAAVDGRAFVAHDQTAHRQIQTCAGTDLGAIEVCMVLDLPDLVAAGKALGLGRSTVGQRLGSDLKILPRMEGSLAQMHLSRNGAEAQVLARTQAGTLAVNGIRAAGRAGDGSVARRADAGLQLDLAGSGQCEVTAGGRHIPPHAHAHALFGGDDINPVGVRSSQNGGVNGICHGGRAGGGHRIGNAGGIGEFAAAHHDFEVVGIDLTIQHHRACHDIQDVDAVAIQAPTVDNNITLIDSETRNTAILCNIGCTSGQQGAVGVDESAAVAGNTPRVGHNYIRTRSRNLHIALQRGAILHDHFVENNLGRIAQVHIALDLTRQIGLYGGYECIVIQHQPLGIHIELVVFIMGKSIGVGCRNIHHRHAIESGINLGIPRCHTHLGRRRLHEEACQAADGCQNDGSAAFAACPGKFRHSNIGAEFFIPDNAVRFIVHFKRPCPQRLGLAEGVISGGCAGNSDQMLALRRSQILKGSNCMASGLDKGLVACMSALIPLRKLTCTPNARPVNAPSGTPSLRL